MYLIAVNWLGEADLAGELQVAACREPVELSHLLCAEDGTPVMAIAGELPPGTPGLDFRTLIFEFGGGGALGLRSAGAVEEGFIQIGLALDRATQLQFASASIYAAGALEPLDEIRKGTLPPGLVNFPKMQREIVKDYFESEHVA